MVYVRRKENAAVIQGQAIPDDPAKVTNTAGTGVIGRPKRIAKPPGHTGEIPSDLLISEVHVNGAWAGL
jgi:hypothetical protein